MKAVIFAGGLGTRISEETHLRPKPMIEIGDKPILWHIMKHYSYYGVHEFIICLGYKAYVIKEYFSNYMLHNSNLTIDLQNNKLDIHHSDAEPWKVTLVDTGLNTMTGGRLKKVARYLQGEPYFYLTYGDSVCDVNLEQLTDFHQNHGKQATLTAINPPERFGVLDLDRNDTIQNFYEKPQNASTYVNGGYFVLSPDVIELIERDDMPWERAPLEQLARNEQLKAFKHHGFWQCMDTLRDRLYLEELWQTGHPPWKIWD